MYFQNDKVNYQDVTGCFKHAETHASFEYITHAPESKHSWNTALAAQFPHLICVNSVGDSGMRYAQIKKTVAYVVVGEDDNGDLVVEKWAIKHDWMRPQHEIVAI
jgi:hypothetical protein